MNAPDTKYAPKFVLSHPERNVVANNQEVTVWMENASGITSTARIVTDLLMIMYCSFEPVHPKESAE
jgi:hypothetical protein